MQITLVDSMSGKIIRPLMDHVDDVFCCWLSIAKSYFVIH